MAARELTVGPEQGIRAGSEVRFVEKAKRFSSEGDSSTAGCITGTSSTFVIGRNPSAAVESLQRIA